MCVCVCVCVCIYIYIYIHTLFLWRYGPTRTMTSFMRFLDLTQRRITGGRTPLDERIARRRDLYLTTHSTHNRHPYPDGIRTHNLSRRVAAHLRLRPRVHWDLCIYTHILHNTVTLVGKNKEKKRLGQTVNAAEKKRLGQTVNAAEKKRLGQAVNAAEKKRLGQTVNAACHFGHSCHRFAARD